MDNYITIPGFEQMSQQQLFDTSVAHVAKTRTRSVRTSRDPLGLSGSKPVCVYSGCGCAAAPFLLESERDNADGLGGWTSLVNRQVVPLHEADFVRELQRAHDLGADVKNSDPNYEPFMVGWKRRMYNIADIFKLDTTELDKVEV